MNIDFDIDCVHNILSLSAMLRAGLPARRELEVRTGLTIIYCETLDAFFVRESLERLEDLPPSALKGIEEFLLSKKMR